LLTVSNRCPPISRPGTIRTRIYPSTSTRCPILYSPASTPRPIRTHRDRLGGSGIHAEEAMHAPTTAFKQRIATRDDARMASLYTWASIHPLWKERALPGSALLTTLVREKFQFTLSGDVDSLPIA
jgi:hypothetical protein